MVRLKHRYLLCEVVFPDGKVDTSIKWGDFVRSIKDAVYLAHGDYGLGCIASSFQVKYFNAYTSVLLLRISRDHYETLWSAMTFMNNLRGRDCIFRVIHLAGTIRSCQKKLLKFNLEQLKQISLTATSTEERCKIDKMIEDLSEEIIL